MLSFGCDRPQYALKYMVWEDRNQSISGIVAIWNERNPDEKVKLIVTPYGGYWEKLLSMCVGKVAPDVFWMTPTYRHDYLGNGLLLDLKPFTDRDNFDLNSLQPQSLVRAWEKDGGLYGINRDFDTVALFYNKAIFDLYKRPYPDPSWDWFRVLEEAEKLTHDTNGDGQPDVWGYYAQIAPQTMLYDMIWTFGGEVITPDEKLSLLDGPGAVSALQFTADLIFKHKVAPPLTSSLGWDAELFKKGMMAMYTEGSWMVPYFQRVENLNWDVAPWPHVNGKRAVVTNGLAECVWSGTRNKELAWRFVQFLMSDEIQRRLTVIPSLKSATRSWLKPKLAPAHQEVFIDSMNFARPFPLGAHFEEWNDVWMAEMELVLASGKKSAAEGLAKVAPKITEILNRED